MKKSELIEQQTRERRELIALITGNTALKQLPKTEATTHIFKPASPSQKVATA